MISYVVDFVTTLSLSAVASNGEVKGGGTYYLISRSLGPEFGGSIGLLFYLSQVLNTAMNVVGLIDCINLSFGSLVPHGYWWGYLSQTVVLVFCTLLCFAGSSLFAKASNGLLVVLLISALSIPLSALVCAPFSDPETRVDFTGIRLATLRSNLFPHSGDGFSFHGLSTFRDLFGILFPATSGIFAGASMSGDLRSPSKSIPVGTLWAMGSTFVLYLVVILSLAASTSHVSLLVQPNIIKEMSIWPPFILAGECAVTFFSALMGLIGASKLMQALGRDKLLPGLSAFAWGTEKSDEPLLALILTYSIAQVALFANLNQIATFISMGYMVTFFVMNLACFLLKIGSAPNFRPAFKFFSWQTAFLGSIMSAGAMFFIDGTYATSSVILLVVLFLLIHYLSPPKRWGDVSQNLIYHQVRKYLLRLKPEHIKFWRPQIILLTNDPRRQTRLIQFCNSMKKGGLYILGHVIVTDDFTTGVTEAKLQQSMWSQYITEYSRIKAFVQLTMSPSITWGARNLILASGLGGMRPNIAVIGFYNMDELRLSRPAMRIPETPLSTTPSFIAGYSDGAARAAQEAQAAQAAVAGSGVGVPRRRRRGDTTSRILEGVLPTDVIKTEGMMKATEYLTILEDLAHRHRINVAVAKGFHNLQTPRSDGSGTKKYLDLWPIQMSAELEADGKSVLTTNFDTYTLIIQLGYILHTVPAWKRVYSLRVMVFVEYESEVEEERGRVEALLDKLRIRAEVHVFWLASGDLATYGAIVQGEADQSTEQLVDEVLTDSQWWHSVQEIRGKITPDETAGESDAADGPLIAGWKRIARRRPSIAHLGELQKHQTVSALARLGVSMGIRTQKLAGRVSRRSRYGSDDTVDFSSDESDGNYTDDDEFGPDFNDVESAVSEGDIGDADEADAIRRPLLMAGPSRRKSHGDAISKRPTLRRKKVDELSAPKNGKQSTASSAGPSSFVPAYSASFASTLGKSYGTMSAAPSSDLSSDAGLGAPPRRTTDAGLLTPSMPASSSMRFSSSVVPETRITNEDSGRTIMFAETSSSGPPQRPAFSRTNSRQSRAGMAESNTKKSSSKTAAAPRPSVSFAEPAKDTALPSAAQAQPQENKPHRPFLSRHSSTPVVQRASVDGEDQEQESPPPGGGEIRVGIAELLADYRSRKHSTGVSSGGSGDGDGNGNGADGSNERKSGSNSGSAAGSSYSTQDLALSFNDLPSRAQHLILNELMRKNSGDDAAVLFTTLPIPDEGTHRDESASVQYLSDVELLCQGLPPVLMILSNNMTVTVGL